MRILVLTHYYAPEIGAPQRRWRTLVGAFADAGHDVAVCAPVPHYPYRKRGELGIKRPAVWRWSDGAFGERILRVPYLRSSGSVPGQLVDQTVSSAFMVGAAAAMRRARPDVIVATTPGLPMPFTAASVAGLLRVPLVTEIRDVWPDLIADTALVERGTRGMLPSAVSRTLETRVLPALFNGALRRSDALVATTESFADQLRERAMPPVTVVRNTSDAPRLTPRRTQRGQHGDLHVLYVGTVGRSQGLETAIRAVADVPGVRLRVVGAGAHWHDLRELALGLTDRVEFYPQTTGIALEDHWEWAHTGLVSLADVPSFTLTIPSKLVSIMARRVHVSGVIAGEAAQIVHDAQAGAVSAPGDIDDIRRMFVELRDDPESTAVGERPVEWLRTHASPQSAARTYLRLLQDVTS